MHLRIESFYFHCRLNKMNLILADAYDYEFVNKKFDIMFFDILDLEVRVVKKMAPEQKVKIENYKKHLRDEDSIFINRG